MFYVIAHNIRSLHNVGAIFRTCDAFGVNKLYLTGYTGAPPREEIKKVSLGAEKTVVWEKIKNINYLLNKLKKEKINIVALEQNKKSIPIKKFKPRFPIALIIGNEVRGISERLLRKADKIVHITMLGKKESLNVSVACGIALYALSRPLGNPIK